VVRLALSGLLAEPFDGLETVLVGTHAGVTQPLDILDGNLLVDWVVFRDADAHVFLGDFRQIDVWVR